MNTPSPTSLSTPVSNTGSQSHLPIDSSLSVGIDYFRGTCYLPDLKAIEELMIAFASLLGDELIWEHNQGSYMGKQWHHRGRSIKGLKWWFTLPGEESGKAHLLISLSGSPLAQIPAYELWKFCREKLLPIHFKTTRIDIALDDYKKRIPEALIEEAAINKNYARVRKIERYQGFRLDKQNPGFTWYFGSKQSDSYLRYYDKEVESKGEIKAYRLEAQYMDGKAQCLWEKWLNLDDSAFHEISPQFLAASVVGLVDFVNRATGDKNLDRKEKLPWWQDFLKAVGGSLRHSSPREDATFERTKKWIDRGVSRSLAIAKKVLGCLQFKAWLDELMAEKAATFRNEDIAKINQWSKGKSNAPQRSTGAIDEVDSEGNKWIWVWRKSTISSYWTKAIFLGKTDRYVHTRCPGESPKSVHVNLVHYGSEQPTWEPEFA